jgi:starch-binding outer membrane protein, SusD/RagB family
MFKYTNMKNNYKIIAAGLVGSLVALSSCSNSFLNKTPIGSVTPATLATASGVNQILIGAYSLLDGEGGNNSGWGSGADNWVYGDVGADNAYKGSTASDQGDIESIQNWTENSTNSYPSEKWDTYYDGVQRSNDVIRTIRAAGATAMAGVDTTEIIAEARFLRGFYELELEKVFKNVPYVDENVTPVNNNYNVPNWDGSNYIDPLPMIEADFQFAMQNLPATQPQVGRANKYAAEAFLAECYLRQIPADYTDAKTLLDDLIANGETSNGLKYALQPVFQNNFNAQGKNTSESVFAVQMSVNDNSANASNTTGQANGNYGASLNFPYNNGPGACCGFDDPSQDLANAYKTDPVTGLPLLNTFQSGLSVSAPNDPYVGTVDPRIDWVMGRPGIPYLDWGPQNSGWMRDTLNDGYFSPKIESYAKSQQQQYSDVNSTFWAGVELSAINITPIRFANILLWDAECEAEIGSLDQAETYVNMIRNRADTTATEVTNGTFNAATYTYTGGTPSDNYYIQPYPAGAFATGGKAYALQAIRFEERLEFAQQGQRFFELQRWDNETPGYMANVLNTYATLEAKIRPLFVGAHFTQGTSEIYPIPQDQIDVENENGTTNLKQNPGYN